MESHTKLKRYLEQIIFFKGQASSLLSGSLIGWMHVTEKVSELLGELYKSYVPQLINRKKRVKIGIKKTEFSLYLF